MEDMAEEYEAHEFLGGTHLMCKLLDDPGKNPR